MRTDKQDERALSRRRVLAGTAFAFGSAALLAVEAAAAEPKLSKADAQYDAKPKDSQHCGGCLSFQAPNGCRFVEGEISPTAWC